VPSSNYALGVGNAYFSSRLALVLLLGLTPLVPRTAHAEASAADRATARTLALEGYTALRSKDYATAADRFQRADELVHAPSLLVDLARAQIGLGKLADAYDNYSRVISEGVAVGSPPAWVKALADAKAEVGPLPARLGWLTITVTPSGAGVTYDDAALAPSALGVKRAADPGQHFIKATAPGFLPSEKSVTVHAGETGAVSIELEQAPPEAQPVAPALSQPSAPLAPEPPGWRAPVTISAFAVGGAGLVLGTVTGILALSKHSSLKDGCANGVCGPSQKSDLDAYYALANLSTVGFIVAGAGVATGTILLLTAPKREATTDSAAWSPFIGIASAGVKGTF
jgi:hypothetical protein